MAISLVSLVLLGVVVYLATQAFTKKKKSLPGPKGWPIIGNLLDMPAAGEENIAWMKLREIYGDVFGLNVAGTTMVIVNSYARAVDIFDKRSAIYSDRATIPMAGKMMGWEGNLAFKPYKEKSFKQGRKLFQQEFGTYATIKKFHPQEEAESVNLLDRLLKEPEDWCNATLKHTGAIIMRIAYGYQKQDDDLVQVVTKCMADAALASSPTSFLVNSLPFLMKVPDWFPGTTWKQQAKIWSAEREHMHNEPLNKVKKEMAEGIAPESFSSRLLAQYAGDEEQIENIRWLAGGIFVGGSDTTFGTLKAFYMVMCNYPDMQAKAQAEIDAVVGSDRLPTYEDRENLPFLDAFIKELYRFFTVAPLAIPHTALSEDVLDGAYVPAGSLVFANVWLMAHDPEIYPDPMSFKPSRFMGPNPQQDPMDYSFGFGRRICPGRFLADTTIWLSIARILATFDVNPVKSEDGKVVMPEMKGTAGIVSHPVPFDCKVTPRSEKAANMIRALVAEQQQ